MPATTGRSSRQAELGGRSAPAGRRDRARPRIDRRQPIDPDARPGHVGGIGPELADEAGLGGDAGHPAGDRLPRVEVPANRRRARPDRVRSRWRAAGRTPSSQLNRPVSAVSSATSPAARRVEPGHGRTGGQRRPRRSGRGSGPVRRSRSRQSPGPLRRAGGRPRRRAGSVRGDRRPPGPGILLGDGPARGARSGSRPGRARRGGRRS